MTDRRSLGQAMTMTPEKLAFIKAGEGSRPESPPAPTKTVELKPAADESAVHGDVRSKEEVSRPTRTRSKTNEKARGDYDAETPFITQLLVPLTTRLRPKTADALRRATLEQRLHHKAPATQQEIVEVAVRQWLKENDYL